MKKKLHFLIMMGSKLLLYGVFSQILFMGVLMANNTVAQKKSVKEVYINIEAQNATVLDIFKKIEKQTDFNFLFDRDYINRKVRLDVNGELSVNDILMQVSKEANLSFRQINNTINVKTREFNFNNLKDAIEVQQQSVTVTGRVTELDSEEGLPGVNVYVKGTTLGTITDIDGKYSIDVPSTESTLVFSSVGFTMEEVVVGNQVVVDVSMVPDITSLAEIVVIGYGTVDKRELTTSVTHITSRDFLNVASTNPLMQIQGRVAGVQVQNTAASDPNASSDIQIRGAGSRLENGNSPLIIINGIPGGDLKNLDDNDIESIDILKGGAAAAIYGTRAANGVIIVTTKKGTMGKSVVEYSGYVSTDRVRNAPELLSAEEFLEHGRGVDEGARTDWADNLIRSNPISHNHSIALSGGSETSQYRASLQYRNFQGIDVSTAREEYGLRLNFHQSAMNDKLEFDVDFAPRFVDESTTDYDAFNQAMQLNPTISPFSNTSASGYTYISAYETYNPVERLEIEERGGTKKFLIGSARVKYNILDNLNTSLMFAQENNDHRRYFFSPSTSVRSIDNNRRGEAEQFYWENSKSVFEWLGNYNYESNDFLLRTTFGYMHQYEIESEFRAKNFDFPSDVLTYDDLNQGRYLIDGRAEMESNRFSNTIIAFFGRAIASLHDKYYFTASLRREGSSKFGPENKWGWFPGASVGWRLTGENFMQSQSIFDDLKLRADYGVTGNQGFDPYQAQRLYSGAGNYFVGGQWIKGFGPANNYNPNLGWEKSINFNIGVDFSVLKNRLNGSIEFYDRRSQDLLGEYNVTVPPNIHERTWVNVGNIMNRGVELTLSGAIVDKEALSYNANLILAYNKNWVGSFSEGQYKQDRIWLKDLPNPGNPGAVILMEEGSEVSSFYMLKHAGLDENGMFLVYKKDADGNFTDTKVLASEALDDDKYHAGSGVPKVTMSFGNSIAYKNFDLNLFFRGAFGHKILNLKNMYYGLKAFDNVNLLRKAYYDGDGIALKDVEDSKKVTDYFLQKGDWVKLDVVSLGYTLNVNNTFKNLRFYVSGRNLATFTGYDGVDPELAPINGIEAGVEEKGYYPSTRTFTLGVQATF
jgi:TonB-linked SusC/RagA family outer membrane protein